MLRTLRLLALLLVVAVAVFAIVGVANDRALGGAGFYSGLDELLKRAAAVREAASPEYQREVLDLAAGQSDDRSRAASRRSHVRGAHRRRAGAQRRAMPASRTSSRTSSTRRASCESAAGKMKPTVRDGVLVVEHVRDDYLRNARPIEIVTDDVGEIVVRARATKGTHFSLAWSPKAQPELPWRYRVDIPLIADGKFHNYTINARNALRRGLDEGNELHFLALQPSDVPGDRVEVDFIRFLSTHSKYLRKPRDLAYETIAGEMRPVMSMLPRQTLEFSAHVPDQDPRLSFGTAVIGRHSRIRFAVQVVSDSKTTELHNQTIEAPGAWHDASYDLRPWAGRDVALRLSVDGEVGSVGLWSNPTVYGRPAQPLRVMIVLEDALRADHLSVYGYDEKTSPFKEELLQSQGAVFLRARSQDNVTRTSLPSMMTSLLPSVTGVWGFADMLRPEFLTLAEVLRQQGFATGSFVQNSNAGPAAGLQQGFDVDSGPDGARSDRRRCSKASRCGTGCAATRTATPSSICTSSIRTDRTSRRRRTTRPIASSRTTAAHRLEARRLARRGVRQVAERREPRSRCTTARSVTTTKCCASSSTQLKAEGLFDDTLFIFTADHGEHFGEHGSWSHRPPGLRAGHGRAADPVPQAANSAAAARRGAGAAARRHADDPRLRGRRQQRPDDAGRLAGRPDRRSRSRVLEVARRSPPRK